MSAVALIFSACDGGGGGSGGLNRAATIRGTVVSFEGGQALWLPESSRRGLFACLSDLIATPAHAGVGGIQVSVEGEDLSTSTTGDGMFILSGVPPGERSIIFTFQTDSGALLLDVPPNSIIDLNDVRVRNGSASPSRVDIEIDDDSEDDDSEDDISADGEDDISQDDVSQDEESGL